MRDSKRIDRIIDLLREVWKKHPDLRLGQLIEIIMQTVNIFNIEDDWTELRLKKILKSGLSSIA